MLGGDPQVRAGLTGSSGFFEEEVVGEAILPALSGLERLHEGMSLLLPVFARMAVLRVVTAADLSADET